MMEEQNNCFNKLDDVSLITCFFYNQNNYLSNKKFLKSNFRALTTINLQLKNCILDQQEVIQLNTSLMECDQLECLTLNLQKEINTEDDISLLFNEDAFLKTLIQNSLDMSKNSYDQIYAAIQFLLKSFKVKSENQPKKLMIQGKTVLADGIPHFQNIKSLNLNL
ncbi:hypothetical protein ABPG73_008384, partial [Tetrahymena malaccensis]